jgi:LAO/AO transport system ATPase
MTIDLRKILSADALAVGRAITTVINTDDRDALHAALSSKGQGAHRVGFTGPPGVGKSTLVAALGRVLVERDELLAVVACDPVSPYSGGAFLGDRVRLAGCRLADEPRIFFRSLACRDSGGVAQEASRAADVLDAAGYPWIFIETVGVGQSELAIRDVVDTVVVVLTAELGDEMQLMKAGILEIADVVVLNRADRGGAEKYREKLAERFASSVRRDPNWTPEIVLTEATRGYGVEMLIGALERHASSRKTIKNRGVSS